MGRARRYIVSRYDPRWGQEETEVWAYTAEDALFQAGPNYHEHGSVSVPPREQAKESTVLGAARALASAVANVERHLPCADHVDTCNRWGADTRWMSECRERFTELDEQRGGADAEG